MSGESREEFERSQPCVMCATGKSDQGAVRPAEWTHIRGEYSWRHPLEADRMMSIECTQPGYVAWMEHLKRGGRCSLQDAFSAGVSWQAARSAPKETRGAELMGAKQEECCSQKERDMGLLQVVDDPSTIFYGPYPCEQCGALICCSALDQGGMAFDYPQGIIYPNTNWVQHVHKSILRIVLPEGTTAGCERCKKMVSAYWQACGCHLCDACYNNSDCWSETASAPESDQWKCKARSANTGANDP